MCRMNKNLNLTAGQVAHKVTRPVLLGQQTLPWKPITIAINLTCTQDRLLKNVASPAQNEPVIGLENGCLRVIVAMSYLWSWLRCNLPINVAVGRCSNLTYAGACSILL